MDRHGGSWAELRATPLRLRLYLAVVAAAAVVGPVALNSSVQTPYTSEQLTVVVPLLVSVLNVEVSRRITGGVSHANQNHKALSAWPSRRRCCCPRCGCWSSSR